MLERSATRCCRLAVRSGPLMCLMSGAANLLSFPMSGLEPWLANIGQCNQPSTRARSDSSSPHPARLWRWGQTVVSMSRSGQEVERVWGSKGKEGEAGREIAADRSSDQQTNRNMVALDSVDEANAAPVCWLKGP